jgi:D-alanine-D-alanine ligase
MISNEKVMAVWDLIKKLADKMDIRLVEEHRWSSSDIGFVDEKKFRIDGMGPIGARPVNGDEFVLRHSLKERASLLASAVIEISNFLKKQEEKPVAFMTGI